MLYKPTLNVKRLVIYQDAEHIAYDETFHGGINIIRGENAHGKSTIINLLLHGLGAERVTFNNDSLKCKYTYVEALINNTPLTLRREITTDIQRPMDIYWGTYDEAIQSPIDKWELYPYRNSNNKVSFSHILFNALGLPEIKTDVSNNLTMHQLLRILCKDQMASVNAIFKDESFDSGDLREEIGGLLCGYSDDRLYEIRLKLRSLREERKNLSQTLKHINSILSEAGEIPDIQKIGIKIKNNSEERGRIQLQLQELQKKKLAPNIASNSKIKHLEDIYKQIEKTNNEITNLKRKLDDLVFESQDSDDFIAYLQSNLQSIERSNLTKKNLGLIDIETCPVCYHILEKEKKDFCPLCQNEFNDLSQNKNILRIKQELAYQIAESKKLQEIRKETIKKYEQNLHQLNENQKQLQLLIDEANLPISGQDFEINQLCKKIGSLDNEILNLNNILLLAEKLEEIQKTLSKFAEDISYNEEEEKRIEKSIENRQNKAKDAISNIILSLLHKDIDTEGILYEKQKFGSATGIHFSFGDDRISVIIKGPNGEEEHRNLAASSHVILKNAFHFALLVASCQNEYFRYPRFLIIDSIEDKGMEADRSHCFQKNIVETSEALKVEHQIIFSTALIASELNINKYTIGDDYQGNIRSLRLR